MNLAKRAATALALFSVPSFAVAATAKDGAFQKTVTPFVAKHCAGCHNDKVQSGDLNLTRYQTPESVRAARDRWDRVLDKLRRGEMPPAGVPHPPEAESSAVIHWLEADFEAQDKAMRPDAGRVTARRLNRFEYNNTVRDLLAVDLRPADDFPVDPFGYGFDNIGEVLSISPVLMEKYLEAARRLAKAAIVPPPIPKKPEYEQNTNVAGRLLFDWNRRFNWEGDYDLRFAVPFLIEGRTDPGDTLVQIDDGPVQKFATSVDFQSEGRFNDVHLHLAAGVHRIRAWVERDLPKSIEVAWKKEQDRIERLKQPQRKGGGGGNRPPEPPKTREQIEKAVNDSPPYIEFVEVRGPLNPKPAPLPDGYRRVFACGHLPGKHTTACIRPNLTQLARRAWRRPITSDESARLARFVTSAQAKGASMEDAMRVGVTAVLVSPNFLFRIERNPPGDKQRPISDYELASRLSYFLWSTMPDEALFQTAASGHLHDAAVLEAQVRRMLKDPKSETLVDNFGGQWLAVRNIDSVRPDPEKFPMFNGNLRDAMKQETRHFLMGMLREDRSILELLNAKYTYLNSTLARFYGIPGVKGGEFQKVDLTGTPRTGILTQASVLTVSSYPTRTSPVLRGKWILENILNTPPPPPPANVPPLDESGAGVTATLRQQIEAHRRNPACAACHAKMDPLGFGLENFDAIGRYREQDGKVPIDSTGELPDGRKFSKPSELAAALLADKPAFTRAVSSKMLTFALGRSLRRTDNLTVDAIAAAVAKDDYRFSGLVSAVATSLPFRARRGEKEEPVQQAASPAANGSERALP